MPITTKWVDVNKGRNGEIQIRNKLLARVFRVKGDERQFDVFAAMPPLEMKRMLFRMAIVDEEGRNQKDQMKLMFVDIKKARLSGKISEDEFT